MSKVIFMLYYSNKGQTKLYSLIVPNGDALMWRSGGHFVGSRTITFASTFQFI